MLSGRGPEDCGSCRWLTVPDTTNTHYVVLKLPADCDKGWWDFTVGYHLGTRVEGMTIVNSGVEWVPLNDDEIQLHAWVDVKAETEHG